MLSNIVPDPGDVDRGGALDVRVKNGSACFYVVFFQFLIFS